MEAIKSAMDAARKAGLGEGAFDFAQDQYVAGVAKLQVWCLGLLVLLRDF